MQHQRNNLNFMLRVLAKLTLIISVIAFSSGCAKNKKIMVRCSKPSDCNDHHECKKTKWKKMSAEECAKAGGVAM